LRTNSVSEQAVDRSVVRRWLTHSRRTRKGGAPTVLAVFPRAVRRWLARWRGRPLPDNKRTRVAGAQVVRRQQRRRPVWQRRGATVAHSHRGRPVRSGVVVAIRVAQPGTVRGQAAVSVKESGAQTLRGRGAVSVKGGGGQTVHHATGPDSVKPT
jgi:hypothetical protein